MTDAINVAKMPPPPSVEARWAWKVMHEVSERTQAEAADILAERFRWPVSQQNVSTWLRQCREWVKRTGLSVEDIQALPGGKERLMSPAAIDFGPRQECRPSAQQQKAEQIQEGSADAGWKYDAESVRPNEGFDGSGYGPANKK